MNIRFLPVAIAAALTFGAAQAREPAKAPVATTQERATQAEIDRLVERIEVLSRQLGEEADVRVIVRRGGHGTGPEAERSMQFDRLPGGRHEFRSGPGLGIVMAPNPAASGVRIAAVTPDSPAMKAGLRSGDVLLVVDGKAIGGNGAKALENARVLLGDLKQDQVVKLRFARQGKTHDARVKADAIRRVMAFNRDTTASMAPRALRHSGDVEHHRQLIMLPPDVELDIERMGPMHDCPPGKADCGLPALYQAFRWQGLNLASLDSSLGRYFGTDEGVLVLGSGPELKGLQSGDVIRRVAGKDVDSPRDVMRVLREKSSGSQVQFDVLRDRKSAAVTVTVPKSRPLPFMVPPAPPAPPVPPTPHAAMPPPAPAPAALPAIPRTPRAAPPPPPAAPAPPEPPREDDAI